MSTVQATTRMCLLGSLFASLILVTPPAHADVYRCKGDGKTSYQDHPCRSGAQAPMDAQARNRERQQALALSASTLPAAEPIAWNGNFQMDIVKVSALLDNIRILGRDCEWELKVTPDDSKACSAFMRKLLPGGDYVQIGTKIQELLQDEAQARAYMAELERIRRHFEDITRYRDFTMARMGK